VLWFNGNGITERYGSEETGANYTMTPAVAAGAFRDDIHIVTGLTTRARLPVLV